MPNGNRNGKFKVLSRTGKRTALNNIQTLLDNVDYYYSQTNQSISKKDITTTLNRLSYLISSDGYETNLGSSVKTGFSRDLECGDGTGGTYLPGDVDASGTIDVLDIVAIVGHVLETSELSDEQVYIADINNDLNLDVLDVVALVNHVLNETIPECDETATCNEETEVELWGQCYNIEETTDIDLQNSGLTGEIPEEICLLQGLTELKLNENNLIGSIPECFGNPSPPHLPNLTILHLDDNNLSTPIPASICNLLDIYESGLDGTDYIYDEELTLSDNNFCQDDFPWCFFQNYGVEYEPVSSGPPPPPDRTCPGEVTYDDCGFQICCYDDLCNEVEEAGCFWLSGGPGPTISGDWDHSCIECTDPNGGPAGYYRCEYELYEVGEGDYQEVLSNQCDSAVDYTPPSWMVGLLEDSTENCAGCMDETALNYNPDAVQDAQHPDEECIYDPIGDVTGCIDPTACNFYTQLACSEGCAQFGGCSSGLDDPTNPQPEPCPNVFGTGPNETCIYDQGCGCNNPVYECFNGIMVCDLADCPTCEEEGLVTCSDGSCVENSEDCEEYIINPDFTIIYEVQLHANYNLVSIPSYIQGFNPASQNTDMSVENFAKYFFPPGSDIEVPSNGCITRIVGEGIAANPDPTLGWVGSLSTIEPGKGYWLNYPTFAERPECYASELGGNNEAGDVNVSIKMTRVEIDMPENGVNLPTDPLYLSPEEAFAYYPELGGDFSLESFYLGIDVFYGAYSNLDTFLLGEYGYVTSDSEEYIPTNLSGVFNRYCDCDYVNSEVCVEGSLQAGDLSCSDLTWSNPLDAKNYAVEQSNTVTSEGFSDLEGSHWEFVFNETAIVNPYTISLWGDFSNLYVESAGDFPKLNIGHRLLMSFSDSEVLLQDNGGSPISQHPACGDSDWGGDESCLGGGLSGLGEVGLIRFSTDIDMQFELSKNYSNIVLKCNESGDKQLFINGIGSDILINNTGNPVAYVDLEDLRVLGVTDVIRFDEVMIYDDFLNIEEIYVNDFAVNPTGDPRLIHWWRFGDSERDSINDIDTYDFVSTHAIADSAYESFGPDLVTVPSHILNLENPLLYFNADILTENLYNSTAYKVTFTASVTDSSKPITLGFASHRDYFGEFVQCPGPMTYQEETFSWNEMVGMILLWRCPTGSGFFNQDQQAFYNTEAECLSECDDCYSFDLGPAFSGQQDGWPLYDNQYDIPGNNLFIVPWDNDNYWAFDCSNQSDCLLPIAGNLSGQHSPPFPSPSVDRNALKFCENIGLNDVINFDQRFIQQGGSWNDPECYEDINMITPAPTGAFGVPTIPPPGETYYCLYPQMFSRWNAPIGGDSDNFHSDMMSTFGVDATPPNDSPEAWIINSQDFNDWNGVSNSYIHSITCGGLKATQPQSPIGGNSNCNVHEILHPSFSSTDETTFSFYFFARGASVQDYPDYSSPNLSPSIEDIKLLVHDMPENQELQISNLTVQVNPGRPLMHRQDLTVMHLNLPYTWDNDTDNGAHFYIENNSTFTEFTTVSNQCYDFDTMAPDIVTDYFNELIDFGFGNEFNVYDMSTGPFVLFQYDADFEYAEPLDIDSLNIQFYEEQLANEVGDNGDNYYQAFDSSEYAIFSYDEDYVYQPFNDTTYLDFLELFYLGLYSDTPDVDNFDWEAFCSDPMNPYDFCYTFTEAGDNNYYFEYISSENFSGFQINFGYACVDSVQYSGYSSDLFQISYSENTILGFSLTGEEIDAGQDILLEINCGGMDCLDCFISTDNDYPDANTVEIGTPAGGELSTILAAPQEENTYYGFDDLDNWLMTSNSEGPINNIIENLNDTITYSLQQIVSTGGFYDVIQDDGDAVPNEDFVVFEYQENGAGVPYLYVDEEELGVEMQYPDIYLNGGGEYQIIGITLLTEDITEYDFETLLNNSYYDTFEEIREYTEGDQIFFRTGEMDTVGSAVYQASATDGICSADSPNEGDSCNPSLEFIQNNCGIAGSFDTCNGIVSWSPNPYLNSNRTFYPGMALVIRVQDEGFIRWGIE